MHLITRDVIDAVARDNPEYGDSNTINGQCFEASLAVQSALFEAGIIDEDGRGSQWDVVSVLSCGHYEIDTNNHWVFRFGNTLIRIQ